MLKVLSRELGNEDSSGYKCLYFWHLLERCFYKVILNWKEGKFIPVTSLKAVSEIIKVLKDFKIKLSDDMIREWVDLIVKNSIIVEPKEKIAVVKDDPKDNVVVGRLFYINFEQYLERFDEIWNIFSKEAVLKGSFDRVFVENSLTASDLITFCSIL